MIDFSILRMSAAAVAMTIATFGPSQAETIRVAVGTQDTTINCAAAKPRPCHRARVRASEAACHAALAAAGGTEPLARLSPLGV
ncbi:hypothetical protein [Bradyrhizobium sp. CCBAU 11361]|uniref:hypothetical protein n=1 Tax=Bradyrhizobium sp. CCBAU 11361 TaxID=1630812 RepID=UPI0023028224|nr:hypothetical protein [Bradyrhizobium sp. CCBAU 11361]